MKKLHGKIDWTIAEDDEAWQARQSAARSEERGGTELPRKAVHRKELAMAMLVAALLPLLLGGWFWQRPSPTTPTSNELQSVVVQEEQTLTHSTSLIANVVHVDKVQRLGDHVMAQVTVKVPEDGKMRAYRQVRFFGKKGDQWQRIAPDPTLMGPAQTLEIANFVIVYRAVDADAVYETAPKLEQLYATLRRDFGLPAADATSSYTIEVAINSVQSLANYNYLQRRMSISSPTLLVAPVEMTPATLLYQATIYPLTRLTLHDSIGQHDTLWKIHFMHWLSMIDALALWELWQDDAPLTSSHGPVVRWLYENSKSERARQRLPDGYERLCRTYQIWQVAPYEILIPLTCTDADLETETNVRLSRNNLVPLSTLQQLHRSDDPREAEKPFTTAITGETMIEYIVAAYGRDKLPQLIAAFGQYTTFDTLIPALFGVSQAEFEAGWQSYLAQHYEK